MMFTCNRKSKSKHIAILSNAKKKDYDKDEVIVEEIQHLEKEFDGKGRILVRASGTEPCVAQKAPRNAP